jgi:hypothetical protein
LISNAVDIRTRAASDAIGVGCEQPGNAAQAREAKPRQLGLARGFRVVLVPQR